ncbi:HsdM family class I SAM-dependent methyltransferase [Tenacibaculum finnmarkense]|uniref:HsdM family class I SAM-dependent methyltransferase n=1 Tax=Tenacibaculum finnmarkense TaxID=2781243 RepID=UPI001EFAF311|nr:N-6 DNA methylase [Tenacibaculum finnmarkense]MCG8219644.1 N-6 DNA methylase [Tenacibaculum finnmarkense genomovar finnmarkense]MCG8746351.1 N-6 DNA methylase [Tenacibaculum finnmarkense]MCG8756288.1 N-6 DNA methylase [Tenacibaculum finnmarkense]
MRHLNQIFDKLNLSKENGLFIASEQRERLFSNRVEKILKETIQPDAFFCIDNKPFILFFENIGKDKKNKLENIWNFNESPIVIIVEQDSVEIYNGFNYDIKKDTLQLFGKEDKLNDFKYFKLVTGKTWEKYEKSFSSKNRIDSYLLKNIESARDILISQSLSQELTNSLIGKVIFVRYLIDRGIKLNFEQKGKSRKWTNQEFCNLLSDKNQVKKFFKYLNDKFKGDLFPITENEIDTIPKDCFSIIIKLLSGDEIVTGQMSLFNLYDFSIIPVEFISNVYELFIGQNQQEKQGAYYTPLFLVDYILAETVEKQIQKKSNYNCKVLDPSCGSGIFLVETLRKIIEKHQQNNPNYLKNIDTYKEDLKQLASDNIFGIDKDKSAINVAIFSIYLTLLDYQEPSDIEDFEFPSLENKNFFSADFFDTKAAFNKAIEKINFDFILGNPPWKRGKGEEKEPLFVKYIKDRRKKEKGESDIEIEISNNEIAQAFVLRISDFSSKNTNISLIVTSKILYNLNAKKFRQYFLDKFLLNKVFELAPVRKEVFNSEGAVAPAAVLFYKYAKNEDTDKNIIKHITLKPSRFFSLFKVFTIQRGDYKEVSQKRLKDYDYLWKILVYGSYLDFNLIKRLKKSFDKVSDIIYSDNYLVKQGLKRKDGNNKINVSEIIGWDFLDTSGRGEKKEIQPFFIFPKHKEWLNDSVGYIYRNKDKTIYTDLFKPPALLIIEGVDNNFRPRCAILNHNAVFTSSITAIKGNIDVLRNINGLMNSKLFPYFVLQNSSYLGVEREQTNDKEDKFSIPYLKNDKIVNLVQKLETLHLEKYELENELQLTFKVEKSISKEKINLDNTVLCAFSFSEQEKDLLNYSTEITIPMIMKHKGYERIFKPLKLESKIISKYINLFFERFNPIYKKLNQKLVVEVKHSNQIIGLFFKLIPLNSKVTSINLVEEKNTKFLELLSSLGVEKVTDRLFIQKDIRGFEENGFYIIKPNKHKIWHKAIGHLDVDEFMDAILVAGKKRRFDV